MAPGRQMKMRQPSQPSIAVAMKQQQKTAMRDGSIFDHYGLLPGTFVFPSGKDLPSYAKDFKSRWALDWYWLKHSVMHFITSFYFARMRTRPKIKLERGKVAGVAKEIYEDMYKHFASGDMSPIEGKLSPGLMGSLRARISQRAANTSMKWSLEKYLSQPKLVWFHSAPFNLKGPRDEQTGLIQAVVRIHSRQRLQKVQRIVGKDRVVREALVDTHGKEIPEDEMERERRRSIKDTTEYVVLQRRVMKSRPSQWMMWGTTEETTLPKLEKMNKQIYQAQQAELAASKGT